MLKEKVVLEFIELNEAIEVLENEHKKHEYPYERELIKETIKDIAKKIESVDGANYGTIKNEKTWGYNTDDEFYIVEKYAKSTSAGVSMYDEFFSVHVEMNTEEMELELQLEYNVETRNLIDAPFRHDSFGAMSLSYSFK